MGKVQRLLLAGLVLAACYGSRVSAQTTNFTNATIGDWNDPLNWDAGVPTGTSTANVNSGGTATISLSNTTGTTFLGGVAGTSGSIQLNSGTQAFTNLLAIGGTGGSELGGSGTFTQINGVTNVANSVRIGIGAGATPSSARGFLSMQSGSFTVGTNSGTFTTGSLSFGAGNGAVGTLNQSDGFMSIGSVSLSRGGGAGTFNLSGGTFQVRGDMSVGGFLNEVTSFGGTGLLTQSGGFISASAAGLGNNFRVGAGTLNAGTYDMSAGTLSIPTTSVGLIVGEHCGGTFLLSGGAINTKAINVGRNTGVGYFDFSGGSIGLTGGGIVVGGNGVASTGNGGTGLWKQSGNTTLTMSGASNVGFANSASSVDGAGTFLLQGGTVRLTGVSSNAALFVVGNTGKGNGTFNVSGGLFDAPTGTLELARGTGTSGFGNGTVNLSGGQMNLGTLSFGTISTAATVKATFNFTGGTLNTKNVNFQGSTSPAPLTLTNNGGTFSPGDGAAVGTTTFVGNENYVQNSNSKLAVDLASLTSFDFISLGQTASTTGNATIDGTIAVQTLAGYDPSPGTTFDVLLADLVSLNPSTLVTGTTPSGNAFEASVVGGTTLRLTVSNVPEPGSAALVVLGSACLLRRRRTSIGIRRR